MTTFQTLFKIMQDDTLPIPQTLISLQKALQEMQKEIKEKLFYLIIEFGTVENPIDARNLSNKIQKELLGIDGENR